MVDIDPDKLSASGQGLGAVATRFTTALAAFRTEIAAYGQPWGADDIGGLIGAAHDEVSSFAFECYQAALEEIGVAGEDLVGMAGQHRTTDKGIDDHFTGVHKGMV
ncbi:hypothetical protein [Longispora urticae]